MQKMVSITGIPEAGYSRDGKWITLTATTASGEAIKLDMPHEGLSELIVLLMNMAHGAAEKRREAGLSDTINPETDELKPFVCNDVGVGLVKDGSLVLLFLKTVGGFRIDCALPAEPTAVNLGKLISDEAQMALAQRRQTPPH